MQDTASPLVGCGGKKVMTAIKRLIADCASVHARKSNANVMKPRYSTHGDIEMHLVPAPSAILHRTRGIRDLETIVVSVVKV